MARSKVEPHVIGLLGGSGAGKSTVAGALREAGAAVIDADEVSRDLCVPGSEVCERIKREFGSEFFSEDGTLNRRKLGAVVFADPDALRRLERITHPAMAAEIARRIAATDAATVILDCAVLLDPAFRDFADEIWAVTAPEKERVARICQRDAISAEQALERLASQLQEPQMLAAADTVLVNEGSEDDLRVKAREALYGSQQ